MENNNGSEITSSETLRVFERSGLGKAPFRFVGMIHQDIAYGEAVISRGEKGGGMITTKPGGTCDHCGAYIVNMFQIESSDGKRFKVGSDCVLKTGDAGLKKIVQAKVSELNKARTAARNAEKIETLRIQLADASIRAKLREFPHPYGFKGMTLLSFADYMFLRGGISGKVKAAKKVAEAIL